MSSKNKILPTMLNTLDVIPHDRKVVMIVRHSTRYPIPLNDPGFDIQLTPEGVTLAKKFGANLPLKIINAYSSTVNRCIKTAESILKGAGVNLPVHTKQLLGEPGAFVTDIILAKDWFIYKPALEMVNAQLKGKNIPGTRPVDIGTQILLNFLLSSTFDEAGLVLGVTHDSVMTCFLYPLLGVSLIDEDMWPEMMEGFCFWLEDTTIFVAWRGKIYKTNSFSTNRF